ncbi:hypothetical protein IQ238_01925 [Pleurocapsales cyanobacterium LEGE 06147]|nr:hypothetical protein [Pleurocapsales cyanobacterium LEGE 06147]
MVIYVQSRGISQDNDYRWLKIQKDKQLCENPQLLIEPINSAGTKPVDLIDSQKFSLILARSHQNLLLLVTGLKTREERTDFMGRKIRNSVIWFYHDDPENEQKIRAIAVLALRGELEAEVDRAINIEGEYGFEVNFEKIRQISDSIVVETNNNADLIPKIGNNSEQLRQELALELETNCLPKQNGLLVLVTSIKTASTLKAAKVWRGLSNRVAYDKLTPIQARYQLDRQTQKKTLLILTAIATVAILVVVVILALK